MTKVDPRTERVNRLSPTIVVSNPFYLPIKSLLLVMKCVFQRQDLQMFGLKLNK